MPRSGVSAALGALFCLCATPAAAEPFEAIVADYQAYLVEHDPETASRMSGNPPEIWRSVRREDVVARSAAAQALLDRLNAADGGDLVDRAVLSALLAERAAEARWGLERTPFTGDWGFQVEPLFDVSETRIRSAEDARALIRRIEAIPALFDANIANMRRGIAEGFVAHRDPTTTMLEQVRGQIHDDPVQSPLFDPFETLPEELDEADALKMAAIAAIAGVIDAYAALAEFVEQEYAPAARSSPSFGRLPGGQDTYRELVALHTTRSGLTPERIHEIGQAEVERIRAEMDGVIEEAGFSGSFEDFLVFLRTDRQFYAETPEDLIEKASAISKRLDAILPTYFGRLPRLPYGVSPVPAAIAPGYTTARYSPGDPEAGKSGTYLVNTYRLDQRPLYELPALSAHEAVPGHHLQIALAQELRTAPEFRRDYYATAFGEGWALYAERVAGEAGIYETPYERFGALSYEMWRACRLVADTGLHWYDWSRDEAEACFRENTALSPLNIETEVTRYIGWPGQALGYKIGEITIRNLRAEAEEALGAGFDITHFHDVVLEEGSTPLDLLEIRVRDWIEDQRSQGVVE